jgi:transposase
MAMRVSKQELKVQFPNAGAVDIGSGSHFAAVPAGRCEKPVREFGSYTQELVALADWFTQCGVDTVAIESTGVYWIPLYELLCSRGFVVYLVNARHVKNVSGRKSDVIDCQWLQQLMSFGLLMGAFRPEDEVCALRAVSRHRDMLIAEQGSYIQRMQKALTQMNVQLTDVISDIVGATGLQIIRAIVAGERDPHKLATRRNYRIHASEEQIAKSLQGNWRAEHLFCLEQSLKLFDTFAELIQRTDAQLQQMLSKLRRSTGELPKNNKKGRGKHAPKFDLRTALYQWAGVDLTRIGGIDVGTALRILAELGPDLSKFKTVKQFAHWLGLCPGTKITGGKKISGATKRIDNRVAQALKLAAQGLQRSQCAMGGYYRRMAARLGTGKAITATAHKLARLVYAMLTKGEEYVERSQEHYEQQHRDRSIRYLQRKAAAYGMRLEPAL